MLNNDTIPRPLRSRRGLWERLSAIAFLSFSTGGYCRIFGAGLPRSAAVSVATLCFFAFVWGLETRFCASSVSNRKKSASFDWGMHYLRGFAIVCIMMAHFKLGFGQFFQAFLAGSTIFFLFISGYLCQYLADRRPIVARDYYWKKACNVFFPYLVWTTITIALVVLLEGNRTGVISSDKITLRSLPNIYLLGWAQGQYWYVPFVLVLFLVSPWLSRTKGETLVFLFIVSIFLAFVFPWRPPTRLDWNPVNGMYRYIYFTWSYLLGFVYARWRSIIERRLAVFAPVALVLGVVLAVPALPRFGSLSVLDRITVPILEGDLAKSLQKFFFLVPILAIAVRLQNKRIVVFDLLATYSFTLFFTHYFFVQDYWDFKQWLFEALSPGRGTRICVLVLLSLLFILQNLGLAILLKKALGRWSRPFIGA